MTSNPSPGGSQEPPSFSEQDTAQSMLALWDAGQLVSTVSMGGLGPGYEQAIQILAMEIMRDNIDKPLPDQATWQTWGDDTVARIDARDPATGKYACGGFSGAQVGAAKQIAFRILRDGWQKAKEGLPEDRIIFVSKFFPKAP